MPRMSVHRGRPVKGKTVSPLQGFPSARYRASQCGGSIIANWRNPKSGAGQCLDDTFRNLFGLLGVYSTVRMFLASIANRRRDYRNHLVLIGHIVLPVLNSGSANCRIWNKALVVH